MRFYFDAAKQSCESFQYEGCDGNANNFQSADACQEYCGAGGQFLRESKNVACIRIVQVVPTGVNRCAMRPHITFWTAATRTRAQTHMNAFQ